MGLRVLEYPALRGRQGSGRRPSALRWAHVAAARTSMLGQQAVGFGRSDLEEVQPP